MSGRTWIIVAMSENRVIGRHGTLPWRLPDDLKFFKERTTGETVVMGRRTFESPGHPLKERTSIVITSQQDYDAKGALVAHSFDEAMELARAQGTEIYIGGGEAVYRAALPVTDHLLITRVHATVEGDAFFPPAAGAEGDSLTWDLVSERHHPKDDRHQYAFTIQRYDRIR